MPDIDTDALAESIATSAAGPLSTTVDGTSVTNRSASDSVETLRFLERRACARRSPLGKIVKVVAPNALGERAE